MQVKESKTSFHFWTSLAKSVLRIVGLSFLFTSHFAYASIFLILAEILGIIEEI